MTNNQLKYYSSLLQKKIRKTEKKFIVEGSTLIDDAIDSGFKCEIIASTPLYQENNPLIIDKYIINRFRTEIISNKDFEKLSDVESPQGVVGVFHEKNINTQLTNEKIICLESISDPGNLGTILRTCDWFGFNQILLSKDCAEIFSPKVIRASAGSVFHIEFKIDDNIIKTLSYLKGKNYSVVTADIKGKNIYSHEFGNNVLIVFSNEAKGPSDELISVTDDRVMIPKFGKAESLNVSSAAAVFLSQLKSKIG